MAGRPTTVRRVEWYLGPDKEILPETLDKLEKQGGWMIQPKIDGMWCMLEVRKPSEGRPHLLKSRDARTPPIGGSEAGDLPTQHLRLPEGTILVGELEAASQWATEVVKVNGLRRIHLFDIPYVPPGTLPAGELRDMNTWQRYGFLQAFHEVLAKDDRDFATRFPLVPSYDDRFLERYQEWVKQGLEGCVVKRRDSVYRTLRMDGKTDHWVRCKKIVTEDYVLMGLGMTPGGKTSLPQPNGIWGLFKDGKLVKAMQTVAPLELLKEENIGKLVVEFKGWERFKSGALRHPQFLRVRTDKQPGECLFKEDGKSYEFGVDVKVA